MDSTLPRGNWPNYTTFVKALAQVDHSYTWLAGFFSVNPDWQTAEGSLNILEINEDGIKDQACSLDGLHTPPIAGNTRIVVLSYYEVDNLNRELLDRVALSLNLPPGFLCRNLLPLGSFVQDVSRNLDRIMNERAPVFPSLDIGFMHELHLSAMVVSPASAFAGATRGSSNNESCGRRDWLMVMRR